MPVPGLPQIFPPSERTLPKMLARQAKRYGGRRLVTVGGRGLTFAETEAAAAGFAAGAGLEGAGADLAGFC